MTKKQSATAGALAYQKVLKRRERMASTTYETFVDIIRITGSVTDTAKRLGVSARTVRRWKAEGVPERSQKVHGKKISNVARGFRTHYKRELDEQIRERRPYHYWRHFGGLGVKHWNVEGAAYEAIRLLLLSECNSSANERNKIKYGYFTFLLKSEVPITGLWTEEGLYTEKDLVKLSSKVRKETRERGSWIESTISDPFFSSFKIPMPHPSQEDRTDCHPDMFEENLQKFYYMPNTRIIELRFVQMRTERGDDEDEY